MGEKLTTGVKYSNGKIRFALIPPTALLWLAAVLTFGAYKYSPDNWTLVKDWREEYTSALYRHVEAWRSGEWHDQETMLPHLAHALCCLVFLLVLAVQYEHEVTDQHSVQERVAKAIEEYAAKKNQPE